MANKNIQIKHHDGTAWVDLFPKTQAVVTMMNDGTTVQSRVTSLISDLASKPTLAQVGVEIEKIVGAAPEALDTLKELADALGNDSNFASTITGQLANKVDKVSGKQLSTQDFTTALKTKLEGLTDHSAAVSALQTGKVDKVTGKQLTTVDFTSAKDTKLTSLKDHTSEISTLQSGKADKTVTYTKTEVDTRINNLQANAIPVSQSAPVGASVWFEEL